MKSPAARLTLLLTAFAASALLTSPALRAADDKADTKVEKKAERKAKHDAEMLKKYDKNGNGKLDPDEEAAMKADQEKKAAKKKARDEKN